MDTVLITQRHFREIRLWPLLHVKYILPCYSYVDSAHALEKEGGTSLSKFEVCDNIDLPTILQVQFEIILSKYT